MVFTNLEASEPPPELSWGCRLRSSVSFEESAAAAHVSEVGVGFLTGRLRNLFTVIKADLIETEVL